MASVYKRGKTLWLHYSVDGVLYRKSLKLKNTKSNMRLALNKAYEIEEIIENNGFPTDEDVTIKRELKENKPINNRTLKESFNYFLNTKQQSPKSKTMYQNAFNKFEEVIETDVPVNSITEFHFGTFKEHLKNKLAYETQRTYVNYMNIFFNYLIKSNQYKKENPFLRLKRRDKKFIRTITDEHFELILKKLNETNKGLYRFIFFLRKTGFRLNEALELRWEQIKWDENIISMTNFKDNSNNDIFPLNIENGTLKEFLLSFKKESGKIFNLNREWCRQPYQKVIEKINEEKKKENKSWKNIPKYTIHDIRRTAISKWAKKLHPLELTKMARHKDIQTTMRYYVNMNMSEIAEKLSS